MKLREQISLALNGVLLLTSISLTPSVALAQEGAGQAVAATQEASAENATDPAAEAGQNLAEAQAETFLASLNFSAGLIELPGGFAQLNLPAGYRYLNPSDAQRVLEEAWGNPPGAGANTLGMVFPAAANPLAQDSWGVILSFDASGYVSDEDAAEIDYDEQLRSMQEETEASNEHRKQLGYETVTLVGWADKPRYDGDKQQLVWAKELKFGDAESNTLNYNTRVLGRNGVLILNAVANMQQLAEIKSSIQSVLASVQFNEGSRYVDFDPKTDKVAEYGLAALVAGGAATVAAKAGFFAKFGKLLIVVILGLGGLLLRALTKK